MNSNPIFKAYLEAEINRIKAELAKLEEMLEFYENCERGEE